MASILSRLDSAQLELLQELHDGTATREIGDRHEINGKTIDSQVESMYELTGFNRKPALIAAAIKAGCIAGPQPDHLPRISLSRRGWSIAWLVAEGLENKEIAQKLKGVGTATVSKELKQIYKCWNISNRTHLAAIIAKMSALGQIQEPCYK